MKISTFLLALIIIAPLKTYPQEKTSLISLKDLITYVLEESLSQKLAKSKAEEGYSLFNAYKAGLGPKLTMSGNVANYTKAYTNITQPDGTVLFQPVSQNYSNLMLSLSQNINLTGGTLMVNSGLARFDDFHFDRKQYNSVPVNVTIAQPLFSFNSYKWDRKIEKLKLEEIEKELNRTISTLSLKTSMLYFDMIEAQADYDLTRKNIESQQTILNIENKRINLGTTNKEKILQIKLQLLNSLQNSQKADMELKIAKMNLINYTGWKGIADFHLQLPEQLPLTNFPLLEMLADARRNRPEYATFQRSLIESEKKLRAAKKERFSLNLMASYGLNNIGTGITDAYRNPNRQQNLSFGVGIPLLDWGRNKAKVNVANVSLQTLKLELELQQRDLEQDITNLVLDIERIKNNIDFAKEADEIAQERYLLSIEQFRFGKTTITELNIALGEKDNARRSFINALRTFWQSYYLLRSLIVITNEG